MSQDEHNPTSNQEQFQVPDGYFHASGLAIMNKLEWQDEMKAYPTLLELKNKSPFTVPDLYFEKSELKLELIPFEQLSKQTKINAFQLPTQYFTAKAKEITAVLTEVDELQSPLLHQLNKEAAFTVPDSYFETSKAQIQNLVQAKSSTKIIPLKVSKIAFAAAAMVLITLGFWITTSKPEVENDADCNTLACIEKRELLKSKQLENLDDEELYELVNPSILETGLKKVNEPAVKAIDSSQQNKLTDELLDDI